MTQTRSICEGVLLYLRTEPWDEDKYLDSPDRQIKNRERVSDALQQHLSVLTQLRQMAIYPNPNTHAQNGAPNALPSHPINIEVWTEEATQSLNAVSLVSPDGISGTSVSLAIDLDEQSRQKQDGIAGTGRRGGNVNTGYHPRREPLRRDSLKRREALLKGKEGSRRRTRWENGSYHNYYI